MAAFSTDPHLCVDRVLEVKSVSRAESLTSAYELDRCVDWIKENDFKKVCLQFPDELLVDSVDVSLHIERSTSRKVYILGDTSYGSCCVDEVAAQHVKADAVVHFGHACLSPVSRLPVLYVFFKAGLNVPSFYDALKGHVLRGPTLVLYDVSYWHKLDELRKCLPDDLKKLLFISELDLPNGHKNPCSPNCELLLNSESRHSTVKFNRAYCQPESGFEHAVYIGETNNPNLQNFLCCLKDVEFTHYTEKDSLSLVTSVNVMKQCSYLVECLKESTNVGILVGTLGIKGNLEAIGHIKNLCRHVKKTSYVLSVGKPNPAKLANFPELDVFVAVSCAEANFGDRKSYIQPIVGLFEVELAFNENRTWDSSYSRDFRDLIPGGDNYIECPEEDTQTTVGVSLVSSKLQNLAPLISDSADVVIKSGMEVTLTGNERFTRTWNGLQQSLDDKEVKLATKGRSGTASGYAEEIEVCDEK